LMVANAMAIASREQHGTRAASAARSDLQRHSPGCTEILGHDIHARDLQLCQELRSGVLDADLKALLPVLRADVLSRLRVGNPKYLQQLEAVSAPLTATGQ